MELGRCAREAAYVFAGTVRSATSARLEGIVVTRVTFDRLRIVAGNPRSDSLVLVLWGGTFEGNAHSIVGAPRFEKKRRYVVLADLDLGSAANRFSPIMYFNQGYFPILRDTLRGIDVVHNHSLHPIARMEGERPVLAPPSGHASGARLSEGEFLKALQRMRESAIPLPSDGQD